VPQIEKDPILLSDLEALIEPTSRGDGLDDVATNSAPPFRSWRMTPPRRWVPAVTLAFGQP
jgi:hypothetical protein